MPLPQIAHHKAGRPPGRESIVGVVALVVAIVAGGLLLALPAPKDGARSSAAAQNAASPIPLAQAWPDAKPTRYSDRLPDGTQFTPELYIDPHTSVGTAPTADGTATRIILRTAKSATELRRLSKDLYPEVAGFTTRGDTLVWAETTYPPNNSEPQIRIWRANWRTAPRPALVTADTGRAVFFDTQYDIVIVGDRVYWVAAEATTVPITQIRSVGLDGGRVTVRRESGTYALSSWPWLVTPYGARADPAQLINMATGQRITVPTTPGELTRCSAAWCRVGIVGPTELIRIDLKRPDGTERRRVAGGESSPILNDVALLDRFEPLISDYSLSDGSIGQRLELYDATSQKTIVVASDVATAQAHDGLLWWATGYESAYTWYALNLRTLTP